ncbi:MAG: hypothetical protein ACRDKB_09050 [Actinomycetota bacterium]
MLKIRGLSGASGFVLGLVVATAIAYAGPLQLLAGEGDQTVVEDVEVGDDLVEGEECPTGEGDGTTGEGDGTTGETGEVEDPCEEGDEEEELAAGDDLEGDVVEDEPEPDFNGDGDNHGKVVSTAAHCPIKGRAHGMLVSEIARDKDATVADAEQACEEALAELEESTESNDDVSSQGGPPAHAGPPEGVGGGPPPWAGPKR